MWRDNDEGFFYTCKTLAAILAAALREPSLLATTLSLIQLDSSTTISAVGVVLCLGLKLRCCCRCCCNKRCCFIAVAAAVVVVVAYASCVAGAFMVVVDGVVVVATASSSDLYAPASLDHVVR